MLKNAELKLDRADKHILDLEREFRAFIDGNAHSIIVEVNQDEGTVSIDAHFNSDPNKKFSPIIGDAVHNIACAMDHIAWEVIGVCGTRSKWTQFPRGRTAQVYESRCNAFVASEDAKEFFRRIGAYEGGSGEVIWAVSHTPRNYRLRRAVLESDNDDVQHYAGAARADRSAGIGREWNFDSGGKSGHTGKG